MSIFGNHTRFFEFYYIFVIQFKPYLVGLFIMTKVTRKMNIQEIEVSKINPATYNRQIDLQQNDSEYQKLKNQ